MKEFNNLMTIVFKLMFTCILFEVMCLLVTAIVLCGNIETITKIKALSYRVKQFDNELIITNQRDWRH